MQGFYDSGTAIPMGAAWGWRALSPTEPFDTGVAYFDPNVNKAMIIMTDGNNKIRPVHPLGSRCRNLNSARYTSEYTGYGYTSDLRLGATANVTDAIDELNARLATVCTKIKTKGITIFTITFGDGVSVTIENIMRDCASSPSNYYDAPSGAQLQTAFQAIGAKLTNLKIAR
jgi:hypothetical protein